MPDLLSTSLSGMLAFQRVIEMTGHNIANANTPGYSRQVAEFTTREGQNFGNGYVGGGTQITTIKRIYDEMLGDQVRTATTARARLGTLDMLASRVSNLLAEADSGLDTGLQGFFNAVQDLANDPASVPARRVVLGAADALAHRFNALDGRLQEIEHELGGRIGEAVASVNRLTQAIADVNDKIVRAQGSTGQPPNDLLDQRDRLVRALAEEVGITTAMQDDGALNVYIASGQTLVTGTDARQLGVRGSEFDPTRRELVYRDAAGNDSPLPSLSGGALGGLLEFRSQVLDPTREALGETALALASRFNEQHAAGMTPGGAMGGDFFAVGEPGIRYSSANAGTPAVSAAVVDVAQVGGSNLVLEYDGADWHLVNAASGEPLPMTGSGTAGDPFVAGGLAITVGGAPAAGDRVMIMPASGKASAFRTVIDDPQALAMAAPVRTLSAQENVGDAVIGKPAVTDPAHPDLLDTVVIEFTSATTYSINGAGAFPYTSGDAIDVNGARFTISGEPAAGDRFTLEPNYNAAGDNSNGLLLADLQSQGILDGGAVSINDNYAQLVAAVGGATQQIRSNLEAQEVILANAEDAWMSKSGVNLDEEAANLLRYQQAYQAAAHVVSVARTLFDSLLNATRR